MRLWCMSTVLLLLLAFLPNPTQGQVEASYRGVFDRSNVLVVVESENGWGLGHSVAGLGCDGRLKIVGVYSDTTAIRAVVSPDTALTIINELLAIDFLGQPAEYREVCGELKPTEDGRISVRQKKSFDAGSTKITLHLGSQVHSVTMRFPAYGAPEALVEWERSFRSLIKRHISE